ncbi:hypothetical protein BT63DRAFT_282868 [Microthyrium microscopicum]|uniref:Uncharacterized protein n=1 Tax=Microthyrium microscopicum TaxID=703497 RepID=A0A6A6UC47_9PEZI|nr:hypothetical protein BT63DRAFT_282868 [Microthyrium microscopicum]
MIQLQSTGDSTIEQHQLITADNLTNCVRSAASVVSSASTILGISPENNVPGAQSSEFGDCFPIEHNETMQRWLSSVSVYRSGPSRVPDDTRSAIWPAEDNEVHHSDSDDDLEQEIVQTLLEKGKEKLTSDDIVAAERLFLNCLARSYQVRSLRLTFEQPVLNLLKEIYYSQEDWSQLQGILIKQVALQSRIATRGGDDGHTLLLELSDALLKLKNYTEARLYGRRALKTARKRQASSRVEATRASLDMLISICQADNDLDGQEAYQLILTDLIQKTKLQSTGSTLPSSPSEVQNKILTENSTANASHLKSASAGLVGLETEHERRETREELQPSDGEQGSSQPQSTSIAQPIEASPIGDSRPVQSSEIALNAAR